MTRTSIAQSFPRSRRTIGSRLLAALLVVPLLLPVLAAPVVAPEPAYGDELADARAQQKDLQRKIQQQRELVASINASQSRLEGRIANSKDQLQGITNRHTLHFDHETRDPEGRYLPDETIAYAPDHQDVERAQHCVRCG